AGDSGVIAYADIAGGEAYPSRFSGYSLDVGDRELAPHAEQMSQQKCQRPPMSNSAAIELNAVERGSQDERSEQGPATKRRNQPALFEQRGPDSQYNRCGQRVRHQAWPYSNCLHQPAQFYGAVGWEATLLRRGIVSSFWFLISRFWFLIQNYSFCFSLLVNQ